MVRLITAVLAVGLLAWTVVRALQTRALATHVTIPFLANATKPTDLDFQGGECDLSLGGGTMTCRFQQLFCDDVRRRARYLPGHDESLRSAFSKKEPAGAGNASREGPQGVCGIVDVTTLQDDGGVRWTMEGERSVTRKDAAPMCRQIDERPEALSWQNIRRPLPCRLLSPATSRGEAWPATWPAFRA